MSHRAQANLEKSGELYKRIEITARREQALVEQLEECRAENKELLADLASERHHLLDLSHENTSLQEQLSRLQNRFQTEEQGFFLLTQNDVLNKRLLQNFMENFDQLVSPTAYRNDFEDQSPYPSSSSS